MIEQLIQKASAQGIVLYVESGQLKFKAKKGALTLELKEQIINNKEAIIQMLNNQAIPDNSLTNKQEKQGYEVSYVQQRMWFVEQMNSESSIYNLVQAFRVKGDIVVDYVQQAFKHIIDRHEILRTHYRDVDGELRQFIGNSNNFEIHYKDIVNDPDVNGQLQQVINNQWTTPFDLECDFMLRVTLLKLAEREYALVVAAHHIAVDGWSMEILNSEYLSTYNALANSEEVNLPALPIQYVDYAAWQRKLLTEDGIQSDLDFWTAELDGIEPVHSLPMDYKRPKEPTNQATSYSFALNKTLTQKVKLLAQSNQVSDFCFLQSIFSILIHRYSGSQEVVIGTPISGRDNAQLEPLIGMFVNNLVINNKVEPEKPYLEFLQSTQKRIVDAMKHQSVPFETLVEKLKLERAENYNPIFQLVFSYEKSRQEEPSNSIDGLSMTELNSDSLTSAFDLNVKAVDTGEDLIIDWVYSTELFDESTIETMCEAYSMLLQSVVDNPQASVSQLALVSSSQKHQQLVSAEPQKTYQNLTHVHHLFEQNAESNPDATALICGDKRLTYGELSSLSNALAKQIIQSETSPQTTVGLVFNRSVEMIVSILAVLKAGAIYVPIDPEYPEERINYIIENSKISLLLGDNSSLSPNYKKTDKFISVEIDDLAAQDCDFVETIPSSIHDIAYIIYTSGSTGQPKGVEVEHYNLSRLFKVTESTFNFTRDDVWTQTHSVSFDFSVWEIWGALCYGGKLLLVEKEAAVDQRQFLELLEQHEVTVLNQTPSAFYQLQQIAVQQNPKLALRHIIFGGEALDVHKIRPWMLSSWSKDCKLSNMYGITETTIHTTHAFIDLDTNTSASLIGLPLDDLSALILDEHGELLPMGAIGELYIGGSGVARGYCSKPELTAERFVSFDFLPAQRFYRTGDLARWNREGLLEYQGRIDHQVKIRGFRIELYEIEQAIAKVYPTSNVIVLPQDFAGSQRLVAYLCGDGSMFNVQYLREQLLDALPQYMVPSAILVIDELPLTVNGKLDRKRLPLPDRIALEFVEPVNDTEIILRDIWAEILQLNTESISVEGNFFELGGHSLMAMQVISAIEEKFQCKLQVRELFANPTIRLLAKSISQSGLVITKDIGVVDSRERLPLSFAQQRLWFVDQLQEGTPEYNITTAVTLPKEIDFRALQSALEDLIQRHEILRTVYKTDGETTYQTTLSEFSFELDVLHSHSLTDDYVQKEINLETNNPFDLSKDLMVRAKLLTNGSNHNVLLLSIHHIAFDEWSFNILLQELSEFYLAHKDNKVVTLQALPFQYADFAFWQRNNVQGHYLESLATYWTERLAGIPELHQLPLDHARPPKQEFAGKLYTQKLSRDLCYKLEGLAKDNNASLFMVVQTALSVLLAGWSKQDDIVMGTPIAGRNHPSLEKLIGFFINSVALRTTVNSEQSFAQLLKDNSSNILDAFNHQDLPFEVLVDSIQPVRDVSYTPIYQISFSFHNIATHKFIDSELQMQAVETENMLVKYDLEVHASIDEELAEINWVYATSLFEESTVSRFAQSFERLLQAIVTNPEHALKNLNFITEPESQGSEDCEQDIQLSDKSIHHLFEQTVGENPDSIAVYCDGATLTYEQLNQQANQLAHYLIEQGRGPGDVIAICSDRTLDLMVAIYAVLKTGAAYLPIDYDYSAKRIEHMLNDDEITTVLIQIDYLSELSLDDKIVIPIDASFRTKLTAELPSTNPDINIDDWNNQLAYLLYSSGSTGTPKCIEISHQALVSSTLSRSKFYPQTMSGLLSVTSISFDASAIGLFWPLVTGSCLHLIDSFSSKDPKAIINYIQEHDVSHFVATAQLYKNMLHIAAEHDQAGPLKVIISGGEALESTTARLHKQLEWTKVASLYNEYGPTEATIWSSAYNCDDWSGGIIPIGKSPAHCNLHVLDGDLNHLPSGIEGELYISGLSLARGYRDDPALTNEKFIQHKEYGLVYKTGDLAKKLDDGNFQFIGRVDDQVKIRGFRIELGEIEHHLRSFEDVKSALVIASENDNQNAIVAYLVPYSNNEVADGLFVDSIRQRLLTKIPEYMMPASLMVLDSIPLTVNGKLDKAKLPEPTFVSYKEYVAPETPLEKQLVEIWQSLLGQEQIGIHDNFFEIGGDSILSIQVISRANKQGINITTKQLFKCQSIFELCKVADISEKPEVSQDDLEGELPLLPIQSKFLKSTKNGKEHFNQSILLDAPSQLRQEQLQMLIKALYQKHDALRLRFSNTNDEWQASFEPLSEEMLEHSIYSEQLSSSQFSTDLESRCQFWQEQFNLETGSLFKAVLFTDNDKQSRLLLVAHHLVVDGVSWRVLLSDLETLFQQLVTEKELSAGLKSVSIRDWSCALNNFVKTDAFRDELHYWKNVHKEDEVLLADGISNDNLGLFSSTLTSATQLSKPDTALLLQSSNHAYSTTINELLLTALYRALCEWKAGDRFAIYMESHGRDHTDIDLDLSETVGWFTSIYPLYLHSETSDLSSLICDIKEQYRNVPNSGLGYGLLCNAKDNSIRLDDSKVPQVEFNYLGQFDQLENDSSNFVVSKESPGNPISPQAKRHCVLGVTGMVTGSQIRFEFDFSDQILSKDSVDHFATLFNQHLTGVINHCASIKEPILTKSDFPLAKVDQSQLLQWQEQYPSILDIYPATPMQEGMIFQSSMDRSAYVTQTYLTLRGQLNSEAFRNAWQQVVNRYAVYRTGFVGMQKRMHQLVVEFAELPWQYEDWTGLSKDQQNDKFSEYLCADKAQGFDIEQPPLMRIAVYKFDDDCYRMIWTHHHTLTDGWCLPIIYSDVLTIYHGLVRQHPVSLPEVADYRDYISWLTKQSREPAELYWSERLGSVKASTPIAVSQYNSSEGSTFEKIEIELDESDTASLKLLAKSLRVTVNTLVQYAWGYLLHRYSSDESIIFGATISGRPPEVDNIEDMVGLFINSIPVKIDFSSSHDINEHLQLIHKDFQESCEFGYLPLVDIQKQSAIGNNALFESLLVFENYPIGQSMTEATQQSEIVIEDFDNDERTEYLLTIIASCSEQLQLSLGYQSCHFEHDNINRISKHLTQVLHSLVAASKTNELPQLQTNEEQALLESVNATKAPFIDDKCIHELIMQQCLQSPNSIAVTCDGKNYTYQQLECSVKALSSQLIKLGSKKNTLIAVNIEKSFEQLVALVAIMHAGASYLPLNTDWPYDHKRKVIINGQCQILVGNNSQSTELSDELDIICQGTSCELAETGLPRVDVSPSDLAYVIFTSGSTGEPKGVMISHSNAINTMEHINKRFRMGSSDSVFAISSIAFDLSVYDYFGPLMVGARVCIPTEQQVTEPSSWCKLVKDEQITLWDSVPQLVQLLIEQAEHEGESADLSSLKAIMMSGDWIPVSLPERISKFCPNADINSLGGATEGSIWSIIYPIRNMDNSWRSIPYGKPLPNQMFYILDVNLQPVPYGVKGELYIGGVGVAQGYWKNETLSNERFITLPVTGERIYRTGDTGRYLPDGNIEFLGRIDDQVKVRGFRVELSEIEYQIKEHLDVVDAVVLVREVNSDQILVAYVHTSPNVQHSELQEQLKSRVRQNLPSYMFPSSFVLLEQMPLTANGKIDKKALPIPELESAQDYKAAETKQEMLLVNIWQDILKKSRVGIHDNFFEIGGDSILSIQVVSKAAREGLHFSTRQLFENQSIFELAKVCTTQHDSSITQENAVGQSKLLPFQRHFLTLNKESHHHFNQAILLETPEDVVFKDLKNMLIALLNKHDALRLRFFQEDNQWHSEFITLNDAFIDRAIIEERSYESEDELEKRCNEWQESFDINTGPLFKALHFKGGDKGRGRLLLIAHHLVVDGVSWRILLSDLQVAYKQLQSGSAIDIGLKSLSVQEWAESLYSVANSLDFEVEKNFWKSNLPIKDSDSQTPLNHGTVASNKEVEFKFSNVITDQLLHKCNQTYRTHINELLLSAVYIALAKSSEKNHIQIMMEGHGRTSAYNDKDLSSTVGWLTCTYPVSLSCETTEPMGVIMAVKEQFRAVPSDGVGFGLLSYVPETELEGCDYQHPDLYGFGFNYLGQIDQEQHQQKGFVVAKESTGKAMDDSLQRLHKLELNGFISNECLHFVLSYSEEIHTRDEVKVIAQDLEDALIDIVQHCTSTDRGLLTLSDVPVAAISQEELNVLQKTYTSIKNLYPSTPMQSGLLFHSLMDCASYVTQVYPVLEGDLNIELFKSAWTRLVDRYDILRTAFVGDTDNLHQLVLFETALPWHFEDISHMQPELQEKYFEDYRLNDRNQGFKFHEAPLMRVALFKLSDSSYQMLCSNHHAICDGWCMPILYGELMEIYNALVESREPNLRSVAPYSDYVEWLQDQSKPAARSFWKEQLNGINNRTSFIYELSYDEQDSSYQEISCELSQSDTERLKAFAQSQRTTMNNLVQYAWGYLMHVYSGDKDVIFGATIAGRPAEVDGVEQMVGLFINTIPVKASFDGEASLSQQISSLHNDFQKSCDYGYLPLHEIQRQSNIKSGERLFDSLVIFENYPLDSGTGEVRSDALNIKQFATDERTDYGLTVSASCSETLAIKIGYYAPQCSDSKIERLLSQYQKLLVDLTKAEVDHPYQESILTNEEHSQICQWQGQPLETDNATIASLFSQQVQSQPEAIAVSYQTQSLSYKELDVLSDKLASYLVHKGVKHQDVVSLVIDKGLWMAIGFIASAKLGAIYLPVNPNQPTGRIDAILKEALPSVVITEQACKHMLGAQSDSQLIVVDHDTTRDAINQCAKVNLPSVNSADIAYYVFTSGTTGKPKGVIISQKAIVASYYAWVDAYRIDTISRKHLQMADIGFDVCIGDMVRALCSGGQMVICDKETLLDAEKLFNIINDNSIEIAEFVPVTLRHLVNYVREHKLQLSTFKYLIVGSDVWYSDEHLAVQQLLPEKTLLVNSYGLSECAVDSSYVVTDHASKLAKGIAVIGKPMKNSILLVLDPKMRNCPIGVEGQLYVAGPSVAEGYLNNKELTGNSFINLPDSQLDKIYKTGDLVRWMEDGNLEYLGRADQQVKIRGFRIELAEIESQILNHPMVSQAVVVVTDNDQLVAYYTKDPSSSNNLTEDMLNADLRSALPDYMIPAAYLVLESMPTTANGKIDRKALPEPSVSIHKEYIEPTSDLEVQLANIWAEVIDIPPERISLNSNFFELGGHSLLIVRLINEVRSRFDCSVRIVDVFNCPELQSLALVIETLLTAKQTINEDSSSYEEELEW